MITQFLNYFGWPGVFNLNVYTNRKTNPSNVSTYKT